MIIQGNQNQYHRHSINHGHTASTAIDMMTHLGGGSGRYPNKPYFEADNDYSGNDWATYWGIALSASTSVDAHAGNSGYNGSESNKESRPDNFTYNIWKRIS